MSTPGKYHISKKGNPARCTAKIRCTLGDNVPHYATKEEALAAIAQEAAQENFAFSSVKKAPAKKAAAAAKKAKSVGAHQEALILRQADIAALSADGLFAEAYNEYDACYGGHLPAGFQPERFIEHVDSESTMVVSREGRYYQVTVGNTYVYGRGDEVEVYAVTPLTKATRPVEEVELTEHLSSEGEDKTLKAPQAVALIQELARFEDEELEKTSPWRKVQSLSPVPDTRGGKQYYTFGEGLEKPKEYLRKDGSKILTFPVKAPRDRSATEEPLPLAVETLVLLEENEERQNGRKYETAQVVYDTRSQEGLMVIIPGGSEYSSRRNLILDERKGTLTTDGHGVLDDKIRREAHENLLKRSTPEEAKRIGTFRSWGSSYESRLDGKQRVLLFKGTGELREEPYFQAEAPL